MTCLIERDLSQSAAFQHSRLGLRLGVACQQECAAAVGDEKADGIVVYVLVEGSVGSDYLALRAADMQDHACFRFGDCDAAALAAVEEPLEEHCRRYLFIGNMGHYDLTDVECVDDAVHTAHVVGMGMSGYEIIQPPNAQICEICDNVVGDLVLAAVHQHGDAVGGDKGAVALTYVYEMHYQPVLSGKGVDGLAEMPVSYEYEQDCRYYEQTYGLQCFLFPL